MKLYDCVYFPYKGVDLCLTCYEKTHSVSLHKLRKSLGLEDKQVQKKRKEIVLFGRENTIDEINAYLGEQKRLNRPIKIFYKEDVTSRTFYTYYIEGPYIKVRSKKGYYISFRIDRIRKIDR